MNQAILGRWLCAFMSWRICAFALDKNYSGIQIGIFES
jgi:hypothetical protein